MDFPFIFRPNQSFTISHTFNKIERPKVGTAHLDLPKVHFFPFSPNPTKGPLKIDSTLLRLTEKWVRPKYPNHTCVHLYTPHYEYSGGEAKIRLRGRSLRPDGGTVTSNGGQGRGGRSKREDEGWKTPVAGGRRQNSVLVRFCGRHERR